MGASERRKEIMRTLCRRRHETISNLATEFGVSERTILRDIETLSLTEPIYTRCGRYGGGIYVADNYSMERMYMTDNEISVLKKLAESEKTQTLDKKEAETLLSIISQYKKPIT